jgi:hypothetical protein
LQRRAKRGRRGEANQAASVRGALTPAWAV